MVSRAKDTYFRGHHISCSLALRAGRHANAAWWTFVCAGCPKNKLQPVACEPSTCQVFPCGCAEFRLQKEDGYKAPTETYFSKRLTIARLRTAAPAATCLSHASGSTACQHSSSTWDEMGTLQSPVFAPRADVVGFCMHGKRSAQHLACM